MARFLTVSAHEFLQPCSAEIPEPAARNSERGIFHEKMVSPSKRFPFLRSRQSKMFFICMVISNSVVLCASRLIIQQAARVIVDNACNYVHESMVYSDSNLGVTALSAEYTFENRRARLTVRFTSPLLLDNPLLVSRPCTYLDCTVQA